MLGSISLSPGPAPGPLGPGRRQQLVADAFEAIAGNLGEEFDLRSYVRDLGARCAALARADAVVISLGDTDGNLRTTVSMPAVFPALWIFTGFAVPGPHLGSFLSAGPVLQPDLSAPDPRWPEFAELAMDAGIRSVFCLPIRQEASAVGVLSLLRVRAGSICRQDLHICEKLADAAVASLFQRRASGNTSWTDSSPQ